MYRNTASVSFARARAIHMTRESITLLSSALEALCDYALYKSTFTLHYQIVAM